MPFSFKFLAPLQLIAGFAQNEPKGRTRRKKQHTTKNAGHTAKREKRGTEEAAQKRRRPRQRQREKAKKGETLATDRKSKETTKIKRPHPVIKHVHKKRKKHENKSSSKNQWPCTPVLPKKKVYIWCFPVEPFLLIKPGLLCSGIDN